MNLTVLLLLNFVVSLTSDSYSVLNKVGAVQVSDTTGGAIWQER